MFKKFTDNSPIRVLILTARIRGVKGIIEEKSDLRNALTFFTELIEGHCKDDRLNANLYLLRFGIHQSEGELTRHIRFPL